MYLCCKCHGDIPLRRNGRQELKTVAVILIHHRIPDHRRRLLAGRLTLKTMHFESLNSVAFANPYVKEHAQCRAYTIPVSI